MTPSYPSLDMQRVKVFPLLQRKSLTRIQAIIVHPESEPAPCSRDEHGFDLLGAIEQCERQVREARQRGATVSLIYGAHLIKNGGGLLVRRLIEEGWITHLATNGAGTIHDWEYAHLGQSTEKVKDNVAAGCFGTWEETGKYQVMALLLGNLQGRGYGESLGQMMLDEQLSVPTRESLREAIAAEPDGTHTAARAELLEALTLHPELTAGIWKIPHPWQSTSVLACAAEKRVPLTVHPGIGYDIIATHPLYHGAALGRASAVDFARFGAAVEGLEGGVVLSVGSAIMGPQVFEKSLSCVNNLRLQEGRPIMAGHTIYVIDLQDGGGWDWTQGEPPVTNPAYYLRFCKSYSRMGGTMHYMSCDNVAFIHHLYRRLCS